MGTFPHLNFWVCHTAGGKTGKQLEAPCWIPWLWDASKLIDSFLVTWSLESPGEFNLWQVLSSIDKRSRLIPAAGSSRKWFACQFRMGKILGQLVHWESPEKKELNEDVYERFQTQRQNMFWRGREGDMVPCYIKEGAWGRANSIGAKGEEYDNMDICPWAASTVGRVLTLESNRF